MGTIMALDILLPIVSPTLGHENNNNLHGDGATIGNNHNSTKAEVNLHDT
jgi:hypothetical protein